MQKNCKSYGAWFHRGFVLKNMTAPDLEKELKMCERFLELDERNFHGWDHRRFVVSLSSVEPKDEFE